MDLFSALRTDELTRRAMLCSALMMAHQVAGKATRDALFLSAFPASNLPRMVIAAAVVSLLLGGAFSLLLTRFGPRRVVPGAFVLSAMIQVLAWHLQTRFLGPVAAGMYLHIVGFGAVLLSGFWSMANEVFDPRTAKLRFGRITGAGTAGGILGGLVAERFAAWLPVQHTLLLLAGFHLLAAGGMRLLRAESGALPAPEPQPSVPSSEVCRRAPYLRSLAGLVLLATASAAIFDYLFKSGAAESFGKGATLLRFFAAFYTSTQLLTFVAQTFLSRPALERLGLGKTVATLPISVGLGGMTALSFPVFPAFVFARGFEQILRGSMFRSGYELFYTPVPAAEKRSAKTLIDVGCDRLGDAVGAGVVQTYLLIAPAVVRSGILGAAVVFSCCATWLALRLDKAYSQILERGLLNRAIELDLEDIEDSTTLSAVMRTRHISSIIAAPVTRPVAAAGPVFEDPVVVSLRALRSGDAGRVRAELNRMPPLDPLLAPQVIRLLAWDEVSHLAREILTRECESILGQLVDHLLDPEEEFTVRRRLPRILAQSQSVRAVSGLIEGLNDVRFEVRFHCARSLDFMRQRDLEIAIPAQRVFDVVDRELSVSRSIWDGRRLLDQRESTDHSAFLDEELRDQADHNLEHVFSLLALVLPREPLKVAFRSLHTEDRLLRGLAREYLDSVLPDALNRKLWSILEASPPRPEVAAP